MCVRLLICGMENGQRLLSCTCRDACVSQLRLAHCDMTGYAGGSWLGTLEVLRHEGVDPVWVSRKNCFGGFVTRDTWHLKWGSNPAQGWPNSNDGLVIVYFPSLATDSRAVIWTDCIHVQDNCCCFLTWWDGPFGFKAVQRGSSHFTEILNCVTWSLCRRTMLRLTNKQKKGKIKQTSQPK